MASTISIISLPDSRWDAFVHQHPDGTIFHTSHWATVIQKTYRYEPYFIISETDGNIYVAIPFFVIRGQLGKKRLVCLPFTDECSPLFVAEKDLEDTMSLIMGMRKNGVISGIEIRSKNFDFATKFDFKKYSYYKLFLLNLDQGLNSIWKNFKQKSIRYPIKKAQRYGVEIIKSTEPEDMKIFYKLNLLTRKKHGVIPQPYRFFK
ncbi:MAG: hypothetical protein ABIL44_11770, partial [candidate division WOR-3 bacterium]